MRQRKPYLADFYGGSAGEMRGKCEESAGKM